MLGEHDTPLAVIRQRHHPTHVQGDGAHEDDQTTICSRDEELWPCDTIRVMYEHDYLATAIAKIRLELP
jgi:hypothetical protein